MIQEKLSMVLADVKQAFVSKRVPTSVVNVLNSMHPADIADLWENLDDSIHLSMFRVLNPDMQSDVLLELDFYQQTELLKQLQDSEIQKLAFYMDSDDLKDLICRLPQEIANKIYGQMNAIDYGHVEELLQYPDDTCGSLMAKEYLSVNKNRTVYQTLIRIKTFGNAGRKIYRVHVVDEEGMLYGHLELQRLILASPKAIIDTIAIRSDVYVHTDMTLREGAHLMRKYDVPVIPVVNRDNILMGEITFDDLMDFLEEENSEEIRQIAGLTEVQDTWSEKSSVLNDFVSRCPWLLIALFGGLLASGIMQCYSELMEKNIVWSFFLPVLMATAGNVGVQSAVLLARNLSYFSLPNFQFVKYLCFDMLSVLCNALGCSLVLFCVVWLFYGMNMALVLSCSLSIIMMTSGILGNIVPFILKKLSFDPLVSMGPFVTILNDLMALWIYFMIVF